MRPESAQAARRRVRETLELFDADPALIDDAELLASEVVTNALLHACRPGAELGLRLVRDGDRFIVEVHDPSREMPPAPHAPDPLSESGRGLFLAASLAADHGVRPAEESGKVVWFQLLAWPGRAEAETAPQAPSAGLPALRREQLQDHDGEGPDDLRKKARRRGAEEFSAPEELRPRAATSQRHRSREGFRSS